VASLFAGHDTLTKRYPCRLLMKFSFAGEQEKAPGVAGRFTTRAQGPAWFEVQIPRSTIKRYPNWLRRPGWRCQRKKFDCSTKRFSKEAFLADAANTFWERGESFARRTGRVSPRSTACSPTHGSEAAEGRSGLFAMITICGWWPAFLRPLRPDLTIAFPSHLFPSADVFNRNCPAPADYR